MAKAVNPEEFSRRVVEHSSWLKSFRESTETNPYSQLQISDATIAAVILNGQDCTSASLNGCRFVSCSFSVCLFDACEFINAVFEGCVFEKCVLRKADLRGSHALRSTFSSCDFTRADLTDASLAGSVLTASVFNYSWLIRTDLRNCELSGISLEHTRISEAKLFNANKFRLGSIVEVSSTVIDWSIAGDGTDLIDFNEARKRLE